MHKAFVLAGLAGIAALGASSAQAATLTSSNFSIGLGFYDTGWSTFETSGANTLLSGDYSVSVSVAGSAASSAGPQFPNRTLLSGGTPAPEGNDSYGSGNVVDFAPSITGIYTGTPGDAAANPNYQIEVVITSISVYVAPYGAGDQQINFNETTVGNSQSQSVQTVAGPAGNINDGSRYSNVAWDPAEFLSALGITSQTRTFSVTNGDTVALDGFEVEGYIRVHYEAVPEPTSMGLLAAVGAGLLSRRRRA